MVSNIELQYLKTVKQQEGKNPMEVSKEINIFKNSQIQFKELNRKIKTLTKDIKKKDIQIEKLKQKIMRLQLR